ncbi:hypothetical protein WN51_01539 [Melipona quadrifasciata]|uniref:Uncharacterized protein n=1 Tax=Melipona quadrifasciata TaxID=166423 RepID=A0A0M8ZYZ2_9HYME|nr:hypothetical protein WN51_01539 [Melipona quadrifasciata]
MDPPLLHRNLGIGGHCGVVNRTFSSNDVVVASRLRIGIGDDLTSSPPKETPKIMSVTYVSSIDEHLLIRNDSPANGKVNESKGKEGRDCKGSPFKMNCGRLFKPGQLIKLRFPSSSHVVHGIERDDLYYRRHRGRDWFRVSARCVTCISNRASNSRAASLRGQCVSSRHGGRCDDQQSLSIHETARSRQLLLGPGCTEGRNQVYISAWQTEPRFTRCTRCTSDRGTRDFIVRVERICKLALIFYSHFSFSPAFVDYSLILTGTELFHQHNSGYKLGLPSCSVVC